MFVIRPSNIHGEGVFSVIPLGEKTVVGRVTWPYKPGENPFLYLTHMGTKINHSYTPNSDLHKRKNGDMFEYFLITTKPIKALEELTVNYNALSDFGNAEPHYV